MKTNRYFLIFLLCLWLQPLWSVDNNKQQGQALCMAGRYAEAVPYLEKSVAQNRRSGAWWYLAIARQHLYDFDGAIEALETYLPVLHSEEWLTRADSLMNMCKIGQRAFEHTLDVVVIDSMLVPRQQFFEYYHLGEESGHILPTDDGLSFENQSADYRILCDGSTISECHRFQDKWDEPHRLEGVGSDEFQIIDPFLLTDGVTLFFACDSIPGMGGLDIYRTTFDAEEGQFYQPERLGMPFNSPYDDYMMAIDESHQVGWWATERHAVPDSVMLYLFIYENEPAVLDEPTISRARIDCIAETWREANGYQALIEEIFNAPQEVEQGPQLHIVVSDGVVYTSEDQFHNKKARETYHESLATEKKIADVEAQLQTMRQSLKTVAPSRRQSVSLRILKAEEELFELYASWRKQVKEYRRLEAVK